MERQRAQKARSRARPTLRRHSGAHALGAVDAQEAHPDPRCPRLHIDGVAVDYAHHPPLAWRSAASRGALRARCLGGGCCGLGGGCGRACWSGRRRRCRGIGRRLARRSAARARTGAAFAGYAIMIAVEMVGIVLRSASCYVVGLGGRLVREIGAVAIRHRYWRVTSGHNHQYEQRHGEPQPKHDVAAIGDPRHNQTIARPKGRSQDMII